MWAAQKVKTTCIAAAHLLQLNKLYASLSRVHGICGGN